MKSLTLGLLLFCYLAVPTWAADNEPKVVAETPETLTFAIPPDAVFPEDSTALQWLIVKGKPTYVVAGSPPDEESRKAFEALSVPERMAFMKRRAMILNIFAQAGHRIGFAPVAIEFAKDVGGALIAKVFKPKPDPEKDKIKALTYEERGRRKIQGVLTQVNKILWSRPTAIAASDEFGLQVGPVGVAIITGAGTSVADAEVANAPPKRTWGFSVGAGVGVNLGVNPSRKYARFSLFAAGELMQKLMGFMAMGQIRAPFGLYGRASEAAERSPVSKGSGYYTPAPGAAFLSDQEFALLATPELFLGTGAAAWETRTAKLNIIGAKIGLGAFGSKWIPYIAPEGALWRVVSGPLSAIGKGAANIVQKVFNRGCKKSVADIAPVPPPAPKS